MRVWVLGFCGSLIACAGSPTVVASRAPAASALADGLRAPSAEEGVRLLEERSHFDIAKDGRKTYTYTLVYRIESKAGLAAWSTFEIGWDPSTQERPRIEATVVDAQGETHELKPDAVTDVVDGGERMLQAELPGMGVGSEVQRQVRYVDREPPPGGIAAGSYALGLSAPVERSRVVFTAPESVPLRVAAVGFDAHSKEVLQDGLRWVELTTRDLPGFVGVQPLLPPDQPRRPRVLYTTASSWAELSRTVLAGLDGWLEGPALERIARRDSAMGAGPRLESLVRRVHRKVRLVPDRESPLQSEPPQIVLQRGSGTLAEKALAMTAVLRRAGYDAHWALLKGGFGEDLRPEVASPKEFDAALVYLADYDLFVDPSSRFEPLGSTRVAHQGRTTWLATHPEGRLVRTPRGDALANRYREVRSIDLVQGPEVDIVEVTTADGTIEGRLRQRFQGGDDMEQQLAGYVQRSYRGGRLLAYEVEDAERLDLPFSLRIQARGGGLVRTSGSEVSVFLPAPILFSWIPDPLRDATLAAQDPTPEQRMAERLLADRVDDFFVPEPFSATVRFEVRVPPSFVLSDGVENRTEPLGPALYHQEMRIEGDRVVVDIGFALDKARLTAQEARAVVGGLRALWSQPVHRLVFEDRAATLIEAGEIEEGLKLLIADAEANEDSAAASLRLAHRLLEVKLGSTAAKWAVRAAEMRPDDIGTLMEVSEILSNDALGRPLGPGFPREEAIAYLRKARRLTPRLPNLNRRLAILLAADERGLDTTDPVQLEEAIVLARAAVQEDPSDREAAELLVRLLMHAERPIDVLQVAAQATRSFEVDAHRLAAKALVRGPKEASKMLLELGIPMDVAVLAAERASRILVERQDYYLAAELLETTSHLAEQPEELQARATLYRSVARGLDRSVVGPAAPVFKLQELLALDDPPIEGLQAVFTDSAWERFRPSNGSMLFGSAARAAQQRARAAGVPVRWPTDLVRSRTEFSVEGDDRTGFRVESQVQPDEGEGPRGVWFVVKDGGYRIQAVESEPALLGRKALDWLERGKPAAARRWLDWAADLLPAPKTPFRTIREEAPRRLKWAAAALAPEDPRSNLILEDALTQAPDSLRASLLAARMTGHARRGEFEAQIAAARQLLELEPASTRAHRGVFAGLLAQGRHEEAEAWARERSRQRDPSFDPLATEELAQLAFYMGRYDQADLLYQDMVDRGFATAETYNNLAWLRLYRGPTTPRDRKLAERAVEMSGGGSSAALHTLATHQVASGNVVEGLQTLGRRHRHSQLEADDWLVVGIALEQLGLIEDAIDALQKVRPEDESEAASGDSTWVLAARRLERLRSP